MSDWTNEQWIVVSQSQLDHSINHCTLATVITYKPSADLYGTFYVHQRIVDTQEGYAEGRQRIARMVATHNALVGFPNPEADVRAMVEALKAAKNALENVPFIGEKYDQQHSDTHLRAWQKINDLLGRLRREP